MPDLIDREVFRRDPPGTPGFMRNLSHPDLKSIRKDVLKTLVCEIHGMLAQRGYNRAGVEWRKSLFFSRSILQLQRSRAGFCVYINVGATLAPSRSLSGTHDGFVLRRFQQFCPELPQAEYEIDSLYYVKLHENKAFRDAVLAVVRNRLVPWLDARHRSLGWIWMPRPEHMARVPMFAPATRA